MADREHRLRLFYYVALEGHLMTIIAKDGSPTLRVHKASHLALPLASATTRS